MALTKHQKLAKEIRAKMALLDTDHPSHGASSNFLQFYCHPSELPSLSSLTEEFNFKTMLKVHHCGLRLFTSNKELQMAVDSLPSKYAPLPIQFVRKNRTQLINSIKPLNKRWIKTFKWNVGMILPSKFLPEFKKKLMTKFLYCQAKDDAPQPTSQFEKEDQENTFTNQIFTFRAYYQEKTIFRKNLNQPVFENFQKVGLEYYKKIKFRRVFKTLVKIELAPRPDSTNAQAYELLLKFTRSRKRKDFDDFKCYWRDRLETFIFANLKWTGTQKKAALTEQFSPKQFSKKKTPTGRWETGQSIDRQMYALFICYFAAIFLENPKEKKAEGEIVLLLWIMFYLSLNPDQKISIDRLLELTTADVSSQLLTIDNLNTPLSFGLSNLIDEYTGGGKSNRQQKLFPNLTLDDLEDSFHLASMELLPEGSIHILPEAFLTFPHTEESMRMVSQSRRQQQKRGFNPINAPILERK